ncbi:MAG: hypothetical protein GY861_16020, partial [bacterium]|nr:hypothetical protein [bacterium]
MVLAQFFSQWIKIIYSTGNVQSSVQINGFVSAPFKVTAGIRQGCPLSALLYVLVSETVVNFVRQDPHVRDVKLHGQEYKVNCYQDDTNFILRDPKSVDRVLCIYQCFKKASGATLKSQKTQLLLLGAAKSYKVPEHLKGYVVERLKVYGFYIGDASFDIPENWEEVFNVLEILEYKVPTMELSLYGKVGIFMTYSLSKMWYRANLITPPPQLVCKAEE